MILEDITELMIVDSFDRGVPNRERVVLRANDTVNVGHFALILGIRTATGMAIPLRDRFLWLGEAELQQGDWIVVFSGAGEPRASRDQKTGEMVHVAHWGQPRTMLNNPDLIPVLIRLDGIALGEADFSLPENCENSSANVKRAKG